jgi:diguanylate cyclase (GGDEF)-like protein
LAVIGGRAFLTSADYRELAERIRIGDLQELLSGELFRNLIFASREDLDELARRITAAANELKEETRNPEQAVNASKEAPEMVVGKTSESVAVTTVGEVEPKKERVSPRSAHLASHYAAPKSEFEEACDSILKGLADKHKIVSLALLLRERNSLISGCATGKYKNISIKVEVGAKDGRLFATAKAGGSLLLSEHAEGFRPLAGSIKVGAKNPGNIVELFPLIVGDEVKAALLVGDSELTEEKRRAISTYCREIALPLEVLRLRHELEQRARLADSLFSFGERINTVAPAETYEAILRLSTDLLHAERGSLLLFDEASNELAVMAAVGPKAEAARQTRVRMGEGVSGAVLLDGRPLVVRDVDQAGHKPAPAERSYKTKSFISYPISLGERKVGVLNVTDKAGGGSYTEVDLSLIESIAPQMALALDRAEWQEKATQFQLMSITDPLTGMLNRRYLIERLDEELKRSKRQDYSMSFMMIDIDDFKVYNDRNGHQAGDLALEMTAQCLKSALRSADVASRYGGEEFCILLPQTTIQEATAIAERIRRRVLRMRFPHGKSQPLGAVTVSIGLSSYSEGIETPEAVIEVADRALYLAKHRGKNRVETYEPAEAEGRDKDVPEEAK